MKLRSPAPRHKWPRRRWNAPDPMNFVVRALDAAVPLQANEAELLSEALFQYGDVPEGRRRLTDLASQ